MVNYTNCTLILSMVRLAVMGFFMGIIGINFPRSRFEFYVFNIIAPFADTLANLSMIELHGDRPGPQLQVWHMPFIVSANIN